MPIHDWARVRPNRFHHFHQCWTIAICNALNNGRLPPAYFAVVERKAGVAEPDVIALERNPPADAVARSEAVAYARKANRITICHLDGEVAAVIEMVSPGNKDCWHALHAFADQMSVFLQAGIHLLIVDLFPPSRRDPRGIHKVIWDRIHDEPFQLPPDEPLTAAAYAAGTETVANIEPLAVGDPLPEMPVFLTAERYVPCPLEATYQTAWEQFPAPLKGPLESPPA
jgi:hypothetical protein